MLARLATAGPTPVSQMKWTSHRGLSGRLRKKVEVVLRETLVQPRMSILATTLASPYGVAAEIRQSISLLRWPVLLHR